MDPIIEVADMAVIDLNFFSFLETRPQIGASLVAQMVKNPPAMQATQVRSQVRSSILAWRSPWTEERGQLQSLGPQRVRHD